jgi:hypothetical protein
MTYLIGSRNSALMNSAEAMTYECKFSSIETGRRRGGGNPAKQRSENAPSPQQTHTSYL